MTPKFCACLLSSLFALLCAACSGDPETPHEAALKVDGDIITLSDPEKAIFLKRATVERDSGSQLRLPGRLVWNEEKTVRVFPQLSGRVQRIAVDVGQTVQVGQVLASLTSADYGQALADARRARADAQLANQALERNRQLREAGIIAEKDWQQSSSAAVAARAEAERAERRLAGLGGESDGNYVLRSPLAGIVVERNLNPGMEFRADQAGAPLFVITDPGSLWIQIDAGEAELALLRKGEPLRIETRQYPGVDFKGVIRHVADFVDPTTRTVKIRGEVPNPDRRLKGEMFVNAWVEQPPSAALQVPSQAVFLVGKQRYVFVDEDNGRFRRQAVETGAEHDGRIDLLNGVKADDRVVVEGNLNLLKYFKPGSK